MDSFNQLEQLTTFWWTVSMDDHQEDCFSDDERLQRSKKPKICIKEVVEAAASPQAVTFDSVNLLPANDQLKPIKVTPIGRIFFDTTSGGDVKAIQDFLIAVSDPVNRSGTGHIYQLSKSSLHTAASLNLQPNYIINTLRKWSESEIASCVVEMISDSMHSFGKARLLMRNRRYYIESSNKEVISLFRREIIRLTVPEIDTENQIAWQILPDQIEAIQKQCMHLGYPLVLEYEYGLEAERLAANMALKKGISLRPYQKASLDNIFCKGMMRSGLIILPCGAGKSLVGVGACCLLGQKAIVLCNSVMSMEQWKQEFLRWSTLTSEGIGCLSSSATKDFKRIQSGGCSVVLSTFEMIAHQRKRSDKGQRMMEWLAYQEWGVMILDEVHAVPARMFRTVLSTVHSHCKLGLTATLVREDNKIKDLHFLVGPKLYEANWSELVRDGYIARIKCNLIQCPMNAEFTQAYLGTQSVKDRVTAMNPEKFRTCQYLIHSHEQRNDKIIVFSDNIFALEYYAKTLNRPYICGYTPKEERIRMLEEFRHNPNSSTLFLSKVADTSIDLPDANVLIQISFHAGSRRQEAQRLGRILRLKTAATHELVENDQFHGYFYSLVSENTSDVKFFLKRQEFLIKQGYSYEVIKSVDLIGEHANSFRLTQEQKAELLKCTIAGIPIQNEAGATPHS